MALNAPGKKLIVRDVFDWKHSNFIQAFTVFVHFIL